MCEADTLANLEVSSREEESARTLYSNGTLVVAILTGFLYFVGTSVGGCQFRTLNQAC